MLKLVPNHGESSKCFVLVEESVFFIQKTFYYHTDFLKGKTKCLKVSSFSYQVSVNKWWCQRKLFYILKCIFVKTEAFIHIHQAWSKAIRYYSVYEGDTKLSLSKGQTTSLSVWLGLKLKIWESCITKKH